LVVLVPNRHHDAQVNTARPGPAPGPADDPVRCHFATGQVGKRPSTTSVAPPRAQAGPS